MSDTSVLIDLERGSFVEPAFRLPFEFTVPDLLYERELKAHGGPDLIRLGLRVEELDGDEVSIALGYLRRRRSLSLPDSFALALAKTNAWTLLSVTEDCVNSQKKKESPATESCGCSTGYSSTASSTGASCTPASTRLPRIRDAGCPERKSANAFSSIPPPDPTAHFVNVRDGKQRRQRHYPPPLPYRRSTAPSSVSRVARLFTSRSISFTSSGAGSGNASNS